MFDPALGLIDTYQCPWAENRQLELLDSLPFCHVLSKWRVLKLLKLFIGAVFSY
jgi:hypothetical protein